MTSHWPTFADGLFWCACDNRTFDTEDEWLEHVVDSVTLELCGLPPAEFVRVRPEDQLRWPRAGHAQPPEQRSSVPHEGS